MIEVARQNTSYSRDEDLISADEESSIPSDADDTSSDEQSKYEISLHQQHQQQMVTPSKRPRIGDMSFTPSSCDSLDTEPSQSIQRDFTRQYNSYSHDPVKSKSHVPFAPSNKLNIIQSTLSRSLSYESISSATSKNSNARDFSSSSFTDSLKKSSPTTRSSPVSELQKYLVTNPPPNALFAPPPIFRDSEFSTSHPRSNNKENISPVPKRARKTPAKSAKGIKTRKLAKGSAESDGETTSSAQSPETSPRMPSLDNDESEFPIIHDDGQKPPYSYASLIGLAILRSEGKKLTLSGIYKWIQDSFEYYRTADGGWQNSIRHNLSLNKAFAKRDRPKEEPGKGNYWVVQPEMEDQFLKHKLRKLPPSAIFSSTTANSKKLQSKEKISPEVSTAESAADDKRSDSLILPAKMPSSLDSEVVVNTSIREYGNLASPGPSSPLMQLEDLALPSLRQSTPPPSVRKRKIKSEDEAFTDSEVAPADLTCSKIPKRSRNDVSTALLSPPPTSSPQAEFEVPVRLPKTPSRSLKDIIHVPLSASPATNLRAHRNRVLRLLSSPMEHHSIKLNELWEDHPLHKVEANSAAFLLDELDELDDLEEDGETNSSSSPSKIKGIFRTEEIWEPESSRSTKAGDLAGTDKKSVISRDVFR